VSSTYRHPCRPKCTQRMYCTWLPYLHYIHTYIPIRLGSSIPCKITHRHQFYAPQTCAQSGMSHCPSSGTVWRPPASRHTPIPPSAIPHVAAQRPHRSSAGTTGGIGIHSKQKMTTIVLGYNPGSVSVCSLDDNMSTAQYHNNFLIRQREQQKMAR